MIRTMVALCLSGTALILSGCSGYPDSPGDYGDSGAIDFRDVSTLQADVKIQLQAAIDAKSVETNIVSSVNCLETSQDRQFICTAEMDDGDRESTTVDVSADGTQWASHN